MNSKAINAQVLKTLKVAKDFHLSFKPADASPLHEYSNYMCHAICFASRENLITEDDANVTSDWITSHLVKDFNNDPEECSSLFGNLVEDVLECGEYINGHYNYWGRYNRHDLMFLVWSAIIDKLEYDCTL